MNHSLRLSLSLLLFVSATLSCTKSAPAPPSSPEPTALQVEARDGAGTLVSGATVTLYSNQNAFIMETGPVSTKTTGSNSRVTFSDLTASRYWLLVKKGCQDNINNVTSTAAALPLNQTSRIVTGLSSTGFLRLTNTSANPYRVYVNGAVWSEMKGGTTVNHGYMPVGSYTIRVLQLSGYLVTPTDRSYVGTVTCGGTLGATFP